MSAGKKLALIAPLVAMGLLAAIVFRKPAGERDVEFGDATANPIVRRVADDSAPAPRRQVPYRLATESDTSFRPPVAATRSSAVEVAVMPRIIERSMSPVGALLQPLETDSATPAPRNAEMPRALELHAASDEPTGEAEPRTHRVVDGDTLSKLAADYLGSAERYLEIFAANRDVLKRPDLLPIGMTLKIPPRAPAASPAASEAKLVPIPPDAWRPAH